MLFDSQQSITGGDRTLSQSTLAIVAKPPDRCTKIGNRSKF